MPFAKRQCRGASGKTENLLALKKVVEPSKKKKKNSDFQIFARISPPSYYDLLEVGKGGWLELAATLIKLFYLSFAAIS
jgi:hypothetical protein